MSRIDSSLAETFFHRSLKLRLQSWRLRLMIASAGASHELGKNRDFPDRQDSGKLPHYRKKIGPFRFLKLVFFRLDLPPKVRDHRPEGYS